MGWAYATVFFLNAPPTTSEPTTKRRAEVGSGTGARTPTVALKLTSAALSIVSKPSVVPTLENWSTANGVG